MIIRSNDLHFWGTQLNKEEDELSSPDKHIHPSQLTEQSHQVQALSHMSMTENKEISVNHLQVEFKEHCKRKMPNLKNQDLLIL